MRCATVRRNIAKLSRRRFTPTVDLEGLTEHIAECPSCEAYLLSLQKHDHLSRLRRRKKFEQLGTQLEELREKEETKEKKEEPKPEPEPKEEEEKP